MTLTLWENGNLAVVSSHESDEIVENAVTVNPTSSVSPSYEAIIESEPSRISSADARAWGYDENSANESRTASDKPPRTYQHVYRICE